MSQISKDELSLMLSASLRYALGRRSYVVVVIGRLVVNYFHNLILWDRQRLIQEIQEAIDIAERSGRTVGDPQDHDFWKKTLIKLKGLNNVQTTLEE